MLILEKIIVGAIESNCYLTGDSKELLIVDPGDEGERILQKIRENGYTAKYIVLTHSHFDHIGAVNFLKSELRLPVLIFSEERELLENAAFLPAWIAGENLCKKADIFLNDEDIIHSGNYKFKVLHTPGHTKGSMCLLCEDILLSGDTLFYQSIGRCDLPTGDVKKMGESVVGKLFKLPDHIRVYPGHGIETTIGYEKEHNEVFRWI